MLARYLDGEIAPSLQRLGFATETVANPAGAGPMLIAERREPGNRTTVLVSNDLTVETSCTDFSFTRGRG
jgi:hypothetical protein